MDKHFELYESIDIINNLNEAMLFILINKYSTMKEDYSMRHINGLYDIETRLTLNRINATLDVLYDACYKFNLNSREEIDDWFDIWKDYLSSLSNIEYRKFLDACISGHNINSFKPPKINFNNEHQKVIRIS